MKIAFRTDASPEIGTGHLMRCLTLADALRSYSHFVQFICKTTESGIISLVRQKGFKLLEISLAEEAREEVDAAATQDILERHPCDWMVVDHYGLHETWQKQVRSCASYIMAIDDLSRNHDVDLLLDQNYKARPDDRYENLTRHGSIVLLGPEFALVRPEFAAVRDVSLQRRGGTSPKNLLISLGGGDTFHATMKVLKGVKTSHCKFDRIDVVVGIGCPGIEELSSTISCIDGALLHVQTTEMAGLMSTADLAILAGGSTTWEKCVVGLPSLVVTLSEDQKSIAAELANIGVHHLLGDIEMVSVENLATLLDNLDPKSLGDMAFRASETCDGRGPYRVVEKIEAATKALRRPSRFQFGEDS